VGLLTGATALRRIEKLSEMLSKSLKKELAISRRIPDTTMRYVLVELKASEFRPLLHMQVKDELRSKRIEADALPIGVIAIDGKTIARGEVGFHAKAQLRHTADGKPYGHLRAVRTVLISSTKQLCLDQDIISGETNEKGYFQSYWLELIKVYAKTNLFEVVSLDAGFASRDNADLIDSSGYGYVIALKENQTEMLRQARWVIDRVYDEEKQEFIAKPEAQTEWQAYQGKQIRRSFFRSSEIAGHMDWKHLKQVWLVVQETKEKSGLIAVEYRYFLTNLLSNRLNGEQCLRLVRLHWTIENGCNWTLDMQWEEDSKAICEDGNAIEVLSWLRLMAYNLSQMLRQGVLREERLSWKDLFDWIRWYFQNARLDLEIDQELAVIGI
jgi:predicted transposase YbfD/YdcC